MIALSKPIITIYRWNGNDLAQLLAISKFSISICLILWPFDLSFRDLVDLLANEIRIFD